MKHAAAALAALLAGACTMQDAAAPDVLPPGHAESATTRALEAGARALQGNAPVAGMDIYVVGFHPMKDAPRMQMEAHHFCRQVNEDLAQCALFDGNTAEANLTGIEYIISERLFLTLPDGERGYWHPHNGEILSGQLIAPGLPAVADTALMRSKMNSYGKTWHTWHSRHGTAAGDALPLGEAMLAWSFSRDGEIDPALVAARDQRLGMDTATVRERRTALRELAQPQEGVDALRAEWPDAQPIPGVKQAPPEP